YDAGVIDPEGIMMSGDRMNLAAQTMNTDIAAFNGQLDGNGDPFGGDDLGSLMGMFYQVISELAMESYTDNAADVGSAGERLKAMGANYRGTEQGNEDDVNRAGERKV
ncbi:hypothetical protein, partial [Longispora urticae]